MVQLGRAAAEERERRYAGSQLEAPLLAMGREVEACRAGR